MGGFWKLATLSLVATAVAAPLAAQRPTGDTSQARHARRRADMGVKAGTDRSRMSSPQSSGPHGTPEPATGRRLWEPVHYQLGQALSLSQELAALDAQTAHKSPGRNKLQIEALGKALTAEENELNRLARNATGADRDQVARVRVHGQQARLHYEELLKVRSDPHAVAQHAAAVHEHLAAAQQIVGPPTPEGRKEGHPKGRR